MKSFVISPVKYQAVLPNIKELAKATGAKHFVLVIDQRLVGLASLAKWQMQFEHRVPVRAGERLKDIAEFPQAVRSFLPFLAGRDPQQIAVVALGGGSVGDWAGFLASVLKRGLKFVNIPSTWLAAMDSAHGGKTGLNVSDFKNQVGTFYPAHVVYCVREVLDLQGADNLRSAFGEAVKMAIISGGPLFQKFLRCKKFDSDFLWRVLPQLVAAKIKVVRQDPFETKGIRQKLNLGHTFGHAIEAEQQMPHGLAVQVGLEFTTEWSFQSKKLKIKDYENIKNLFSKSGLAPLAPLPTERLALRLQQDKKTSGDQELRYVFIAGPGRVQVAQVKLDEIVRAARDLGWAR